MWMHDQGLLPEAARDALWSELGRMGSLQDVVRWGFALSPPAQVTDVVVQDEYCHDVVFQWRNSVYLAFDTT